MSRDLPPLVRTDAEISGPMEARPAMMALGSALLGLGPDGCLVLFQYLRRYGDRVTSNALRSGTVADFHGAANFNALLISFDAYMRKAIEAAEGGPEYADHPDLETEIHDA
jgi:hypothetical protein